MRTRLRYLWDRLRVSYWFLPIVMALFAVLLAVVCLAIDAAVPDAALRDSPLLFIADADAERNLLLSVGTVTLGTAGVVFSLTTVPLTVAASQFGSRLLRNFLRDYQTQTVLGAYFGTFVYCMVVLFSIPYGPESSERQLPHISATLSLGLALGSLCLLIFFVHHIAVSLQAPTVIAEVSNELKDAIADYQRAICVSPSNAHQQGAQAQRLETDSREDGVPLPALHTGYIHGIDLAMLVAQAGYHRLVFRLLHRPGEFVVAGDTLAYAWPPEEAPRPLEVLVESVNAAYLLGHQRIPAQDVEFAVNQLVEIAVRALSPAINDPFTALSCLDRLGVALRRVANHPAACPYRYDSGGDLRVIHPVVSLPDLADAAFHLIRQYGRGNAEVLLRILEAVRTAGVGVSREEDRVALLRHADLALAEAESPALPNPADRERVRARYQDIVACLNRQENPGAKELA